MLVEKKVHPINNSSRRDEMLVASVRIKRHPDGITNMLPDGASIRYCA